MPRTPPTPKAGPLAPAEFLASSERGLVATGGLDTDGRLATIEETPVLRRREETVVPQNSALVGIRAHDSKRPRRARDAGIGVSQRLWEEPIWT